MNQILLELTGSEVSQCFSRHSHVGILDGEHTASAPATTVRTVYIHFAWG